jgi:hypothetical protein
VRVGIHTSLGEGGGGGGAWGQLQDPTGGLPYEVIAWMYSYSAGAHFSTEAGGVYSIHPLFNRYIIIFTTVYLN